MKDEGWHFVGIDNYIELPDNWDEDLNQPNEFPISDAGFKKLIEDHQARPFYPNCYKCQRQSAIVGCSSRDDGLCTGTELFIKRERKDNNCTTDKFKDKNCMGLWNVDQICRDTDCKYHKDFVGYICTCPQGSICEFFDKENETCRYGEI